MSDHDPGEATLLLRRWSEGDPSAEKRLYEMLYRELHGLARGHLRAGMGGLSLQPTALVNDAWLRLVETDKVGLRDRTHFLSLASRAMRCILIDHARRRNALKRGGRDVERVPLDAVVEALEERSADLAALGDALERLQTEDESLARVVELRFFGGLSMEEVAGALEVSKATAERRWRLARIWLRAELEPPDGD